MRTSVMLEPQDGLRYDQILAMATAAESAGVHGLYRSDHYHSFSEEGVPSTDAWATLAGVAVSTQRLVLGTLVSPATFRRVGNLARVVATVAGMAGNGPDGGTRIHVGMGTGWFEPEHRQHGFPFEDLDTRYRRLEEHLRVLHGLWNGEAQPFSFAGDFVTIIDATFATIPTPRPRIIVGGQGRERTPTLAATLADELNVVMRPPEDVAERAAVAARVRDELGLPPIDVTVMGPTVLGRDEAEAEERLSRLADHQGQPVEKVRAWVEKAGVLGGPDRARARVAAYADAGAIGIACQHVLIDDLDMVPLIAALAT